MLGHEARVDGEGRHARSLRITADRPPAHRRRRSGCCRSACSSGRTRRSRSRHVLGRDVLLERRPLAVELLDVRRSMVARPRLAPRRVPDGRLRDHGVRIHHVHADALGPSSASAGEARPPWPCCRPSCSCRPPSRSWRRRTPGSAAPLPLQDAEGLARDEEVAGREDRVQPLPVLEARVLDGARRRDAGGEHRHVHAAEGQDGLPEGADDGPSSVTSMRTASAWLPISLAAPAPSSLMSASTTCAPRRASPSAAARPMPLARRRDERRRPVISFSGGICVSL